jgi:valyl-tRNA synthetase
MAKGRLESDGPDREDAANVLAWVLERTLRFLHPTMPFVTEEIWQRFGIGGSIALAPWPESHPEHADPNVEASFEFVQEVVTAVRQFRSKHGISPSARFGATVGTPATARPAVEELSDRIGRLAGVTPVSIVDRASEQIAGGTTLALTDGFVHLPAGLFDEDAERGRLAKQREEIDAQLTRTSAKLENPGFLSKADPGIVAGEREKLERFRTQIAEIDARLVDLEG